jgi:hypothetical protein
MTAAGSGTAAGAPGAPAGGAGGSRPPPGQPHWTERWLSIGEKITVIASFVAVIWLSRMQSEADLALARRETTLALVTLSFSEPVFNAKEHLAKEFSQNAARNASAFLGAKPQALPSDLRDSFVVLVEFYNNVAICHATEACDKSLADEFFRTDACDFLRLYDEIAKKKIDREYGKPITDKLSGYCATARS